MSIPPVICRAKVAVVFPSFQSGRVAPRQSGRWTRHRRACAAGSYEVTPTDRAVVRMGVQAGPTDRFQDSPQRRQPVNGVRPGLGIHPHADRFRRRGGRSDQRRLIPRCRSAPPGGEGRCSGTAFSAWLIRDRGLDSTDATLGHNRGLCDGDRHSFGSTLGGGPTRS